MRAARDIEVDEITGLKPAELAAKIGSYHGLIVRSASTVTADVLAEATNLKVIGRAGIGVDNIDVDAATKKGIVVMNTPAGNNVTTAEHAISLLLSLARSIPQATASMKAGKWEKGRFTGSEVFNKTLGVIGIGNIGSLVVERALGLKMRVIAFDPFISTEVAQRMGIELVGLDDLYERADFITVHTPLTPETRGLVGAAAFAKMKKGVRVINCARGGIVDEDALAAAIRDGKVAGAALDVFVKEPPPADHPLLHLDQVICTPHLGAATDEAQVNVSVAIAEQVVNYLATGAIKDAVNVPSIGPEQLEVLGPYLTLCEKLGSLQGQLLAAAPAEVTIEYAGDGRRRERQAAHPRRAARVYRPSVGVGRRELRQRPVHRARARHQGGRVEDGAVEGVLQPGDGDGRHARRVPARWPAPSSGGASSASCASTTSFSTRTRRATS